MSNGLVGACDWEMPMVQNRENAQLRVEFGPVRGGRELVLRDEVSGLTIARLTVDAEQFLRIMNGSGTSAEGWLLPEEARGTLGRLTARTTLYVDHSAGAETVKAWAREAAKSIGADFTEVREVGELIRVSFTFSAGADEPRRDVEQARAMLVQHAAASHLSVRAAPRA